MNKYIDAEKLIKSINNYRESANAALYPIVGNSDYYKGKIDACKDILRAIDSLSQPHWKPSEEQMKALKDMINRALLTCRQQVPLESLYNDLQKLL